MTTEYLVLQASYPVKGIFDIVMSEKLDMRWATLQEALDELGQQNWDLCTTVYGPTTARGEAGDHACQALIFKRGS